MIGQDAYWINPRGKIAGVGNTHIQSVVKDPTKFGLNRSYIEKMYDKYGEMIGQEGRAREDIIRLLIGQGFIRIRKYRNQGYTVSINKLNNKTKDILQLWAYGILNGEYGFKEKELYASVKIDPIIGNLITKYNVSEISKWALMNEDMTLVYEDICQWEDQESFDIKSFKEFIDKVH